MKVTTRKKEPRHTAFGELPAIGTTFRYEGAYYMNIQAVTLRVRYGPDPNAVNAFCLNNGTLHYIQPGDLIEVVEAELVVITND